MQHVGGDDRRPAAVVSLAGCGGESFEGGLADVLAFGLGHRGEEREQDATGAGAVSGPASISRAMPCAVMWSASAAESRPSRFIS
jgi:hypothetical protein